MSNEKKEPLLRVEDLIVEYTSGGKIIQRKGATFYAVATKAVPEKANEVAGLMILAISAGAGSGPVCGAIVRWSGDAHWGMLFVALCVGYMLWASFKLKIKQ